MSETLPRLLAVPAVAEALCSTPGNVYRLIEERRLPVYRIGRRVLVAEPDLAEWLAERRVEARPPAADLPRLVIASARTRQAPHLGRKVKA